MKVPNKFIDRLQFATSEELQHIHNTSMQILQNAGVIFNSSEALEIFTKNGFQHDHGKVLISEKDVLKALESTPKTFKIQARNRKNDVWIGNDNFVLLPTVGAPNVTLLNGEQQPAKIKDFETCCKLVQSSKHLDMGGWLMVQPHDVPLKTAHLDMLLNYLTLCDKPLLGAFGDGEMAGDTIKMAMMIFGDQEYLEKNPVTAFIVNVLSPLQFSEEQVDVIMTAAKYHQPIVISNMALAGSTAPVKIAGLLSQINAEIMAGLVFSQLIGPGTPVVYGTTSAPMDMKTSISSLGAWETIKIASIASQIAQMYEIPSRNGGSLCDSHLPDAQAATEGSLLLSNSIRNGANFILHACGQIASFMAMSFEKWLIDEEACSLIKGYLSPLKINKETTNLDIICEIGSTGQYLSHLSTFKHFKELSRPQFLNRDNHERWKQKGSLDCANMASKELSKRLGEFEKPYIDESLEKDLKTFVQKKTL